MGQPADEVQMEARVVRKRRPEVLKQVLNAGGRVGKFNASGVDDVQPVVWQPGRERQLVRGEMGKDDRFPRAQPLDLARHDRVHGEDEIGPGENEARHQGLAGAP